MKHLDRFKHKKTGQIYTLFCLETKTLDKGWFTYDIDCWILVCRESNDRMSQWCGVTEGISPMGAFGGHFKDFEKVEGPAF